MLKRILFSGFLVFLFLQLHAQEKYVLSGTVRDSANGEDMIGATVFVKELNTGVGTNAYGYFSMTLPRGTYTVSINYVGFQTFTRTIEMNGNYKLDIALQEQRLETREVVVTTERKDAQVKNMEMGTTKLEMKTINAIPPLLGEVDVIRSLQLLPGISTVGEGASGFNVRGGAIDQNLVLLDEAPVYNTSHLFGFFSVFNPDAVKEIKLSKAAIAAQYGGRLSSVLDVRMKEGNMKKIKVQGGVSTIFSRLTVEGPIKKDKASFIISARRSYIDVLAKPFLGSGFSNLKLYFYDLTAKANYLINANNRLYISGYAGRDNFGFGSGGFSWGNSTASIRWNHLFSRKLFMNLTTFYSNYNYKLAFGQDTPDDSFVWTSKILNYSGKADFNWYLNEKNTISFGGQSIYYTFVPSNGVGVSRGVSSDISLPHQYAIENALYASNEQKVLPRLTLSYGIRFSFFNYLGKGTARYYSDVRNANGFKDPIGFQQYDNFQTIQAYVNPEPRVGINYSINESSSFKASYNRMAQYIHLISNTTASLPIDVYMPSTNNIKPQLVDQYSLGYFKNFGSDGSIETSVEVFYKNMYNQVDYANGANIRFNPNLEGELLQGKGRAYGMEVYIKKTEGRFTGWISYTLSKSERQINGINQNNWYPTRFDRRHNLSIVGMYNLTDRWNLSSTFTLGTGTPYTFADSKFYLQGYIVPVISNDARNNFRTPVYDRLDVSATLKSKEKERKSRLFKTYSWEMVFSVYNLYNRRNTFSIIPQADNNDPAITQAMRFSIIGSFVPAVTYNFKF